VVLPYEANRTDKAPADFSPTQGLAGFFARPAAHPDGIGLGSDQGGVEKGLPGRPAQQRVLGGAARGSVVYEFGIGDTGT